MQATRNRPLQARGRNVGAAIYGAPTLGSRARNDDAANKEVKMKSVCILVTFFITLSANTVPLCAEEGQAGSKGMGLTVEPGGLLVQYVPLGETYDFTKEVGIPLTIYNRDDQEHTYLLSTSKPSEVGTRKWLKGYLEIPDPSWVWFDEEEVTVGANGSSKVNLYLKIPEEEKYYNQHWSVSLGVSGKPGAGQMLALALRPRIEIETLSKGDVSETPSGHLAAVPSTLVFEDVALGETVKLLLKIFNNDNQKHRYRITPKVFPHDPAKRLIYPSQKFFWIPNVNWLRPEKKKIKIAPHESKELSVEVNVPVEEKHYRKNWEAVLWIEPEYGHPAFARIQIQTEQGKTHEV